MYHILDMIYKLESSLKQFYKEPFYSKQPPNLFIMTLLLDSGPRNMHMKFTKPV